jgi:SsrA-binding protein
MEAGIVLIGAEVKSVKQGKVSLGEAFARVDDEGELWLHNCHIHPYEFADNRDYEPTRTRKLLLKKKEILNLAKKTEGKNLALVPTAIYAKRGRIKVEIAIGKGKKKWDKRAAVKKREQEREARRAMKNRG